MPAEWQSHALRLIKREGSTYIAVRKRATRKHPPPGNTSLHRAEAHCLQASIAVSQFILTVVEEGGKRNDLGYRLGIYASQLGVSRL
jgi:hypothetical protein